MAPEVYELVAMGMRYWFVLLAFLIAVSCWRWLRADRLAYVDALALLPDAGLVGELVDLQTGETVPLVREGTLGSGKACDMRVPGLRKREASLEFEDGKGVKVIPLRGSQPIALDEAPARKHHALHGTRIAIGDHLFRVRLFAGLDVPDRAYAGHELAAISVEGPPEANTAEAVDGTQDLSDEVLINPVAETDVSSEHLAAQQTWQYAIPPEVSQHPQEAPAQETTRRSRLIRHRRGDRHGR